MKSNDHAFVSITTDALRGVTGGTTIGQVIGGPVGRVIDSVLNPTVVGHAGPRLPPGAILNAR